MFSDYLLKPNTISLKRKKFDNKVNCRFESKDGLYEVFNTLGLPHTWQVAYTDKSSALMSKEQMKQLDIKKQYSSFQKARDDIQFQLQNLLHDIHISKQLHHTNKILYFLYDSSLSPDFYVDRILDLETYNTKTIWKADQIFRNDVFLPEKKLLLTAKNQRQIIDSLYQYVNNNLPELYYHEKNTIEKFKSNHIGLHIGLNQKYHSWWWLFVCPHTNLQKVFD